MSYINDTKSYDSYIEQISNLFYNAIKNNTLMWQKEWSAAQIQTNLAHNPVTKTQYKGLNSLVLELTREEKQYNSSTWLTFNQIKQLGGYVERGSKSVPIAFYTKHKLVEKENNQGEKEKVLEELKIPVFKKSSVFNLDQVRGIEKEKIEKLLSDKSYILNDNFIDISQCENILKKSNIEFIHTKGSAAAYYNMTQDKIHLPSKEQFKNEEAYYSTAFHELGHATGHESRLNRNFSSNKLDYAKEELRAEIYSYLQAKELGIGYNLQNHQSYVKSWLEVLNNDKQEILKAVKDSLKMMKYVKTQWIDPTITKTISQVKSISQEIQHQEQKNTQNQVNQINPKTNFAQIPMNRLLEYLGFEVKKHGNHLVMSDGTDKVIISRSIGYEKEGKTLGVGNYVYFNPQNDKDNGTIFHFCKNRNIDIKKLVQGADIKDYSHAIKITDSKYYDPQVLNKYNELESYNKSAAKSLSQIRKINPKIISKFDSIKIDNYKNVIFPSYTYEEVNLDKTEAKTSNLYKGLTISGMNKKLIEKPLTHDRNGNKYDKPLNSLEEGKAGLSILIPNNVKLQDLTQVITGENSIDNLSYAELKKIDLTKTALVSFNGSMKEEAIKAFKYLINKELPNIKNVTAAFDNDKQGIEYDEKLKNIIKENKPNLELKIDKSNLKDWNDQLKQYKKEIGRTFANARSYEKSFTLELEK